jgi:HEAT repeat protein
MGAQLGASDAATCIAALTDTNWKTRWQACQTLGELKDRAAVQALTGALADANQWVRIVAAEALGQIGDRAATHALILTLNDDSIWVRRASVVALGQIGDEEAIPPLMNRLLDPPNSEWPEELRDAIARTLGGIGEQALQTLIHALDDPDPWVSCAAARALGQIGDPKAIAPLAALTKQQHKLIRSSATQALAQIADVRAVRAALSTDEAPRAFWKLMALKEIDESTIEQLQGLLDDPNEQVRSQAAAVLRHLGDEQSAEPLAASLRAEAQPAIVMKEADRSPRQGVSLPTSEPLAETVSDRQETIDPLVSALRDPITQVRLAAAEALGKVGDASAFPALTQALQDKDSHVRAAAARSIGEIGARASP